MVHSAPAVRRLALLALSAVVLAQAGCHRGARTAEGKPIPPPPKPGTPAAQMLVTWNKGIEVGTDPVSQRPVAALVGRMYLFEDKPAFPLTGDGKVTVELYDDSKRNLGEQPKRLETWVIDAENLKRLLRKDTIGDGYTLALPWASYKGDISSVHLVTRYEPKAGTPLMHTDRVITLDHGQAPQLVNKGAAPASTIQPVSAKN